MKQHLHLWVVLLTVIIAGCSTGPFLKPSSSLGSYSTVNPACPGAQEVIEFSPEKQPWVLLRVYATPPGRYNSKGTELRIHFWFQYLKGEPQPSLFFLTDKEKKLINERSSKDYVATTSKPTVTVVLPNGNKREIIIPAFEKPFDAQRELVEWWGNGVQISPDSLDSFTVIFPDIYVNGEKIAVPPIHFQKTEDHYAPVLNC